MKLADILEQLAYGELSRLAYAKTGTIVEADWPKVIPHINLGLTELHKRFPLQLEEVAVQQYEQISMYKLHSDFAVTNTGSTEPVKYIVDTSFYPFKDNVLKILSVHNEIGEELYLNDSNNDWSIQTPSYDTIQVPDPEAANELAVIYQANHAKILIAGLDPATEEINLSGAYLEALLQYVAARAFASVPSLEGISDSNNYMGKFERSCLKITEMNLISDDNTSNLKLEQRGWV